MNDANYDEWAGYGGSLFSEIKEDAEDREADKSFAKVEDYMDGRRKKKREEKARELSLKYAQEQTDVSSRFVDVKKRLAEVSVEDWLSLPEAQDLVKMNRKKRSDFQRYTPVPDSVLASAASDGQLANSIDPSTIDKTEDSLGGTLTSKAA